MKIKKILIILLILIISTIFVNATIGSYIIKYATGAITSESGEVVAKLTQLAMGTPPSSILTSEVLSQMPQEIQQVYSLTNPEELVKSEALKQLQKQNPNLANAVAKFKEYQGVIDEISEDKRPIIEINQEGQTFFIDGKTKEPLFTFGTNSAWQLSGINKETEEFTLIRKKESLADYGKKCSNKRRENCDPLVIRGTEVNLGNEEGKITFKFEKTGNRVGQSVINIQEGTADLVVGGVNFENIGIGEIRTFQRKDGSSEIKYASFISGSPDKFKKSTQYNFKYGDRTYSFDAEQGGKVLFDPENKKLEGNEKSILKFENKVIGSEKGLFSVQLQDGIPVRIDYSAKGIFIDNSNIIQTTSSEPFSVCFGPKDLTQQRCSDATNNLRIDYQNDLNDIRSKGNIRYQIGFTEITGKKGSETIFQQTPNYEYYFQVEKGTAILKKDEIEVDITYNKPCTSSITSSVFEIYKSEKRDCGTIVNLKRTGIPSVVTESVSIVDKDKINGYTIGPKGGILVTNFETGNNIAGTFDPDEQSLDIKNLWGARFGSRELTTTGMFDFMIKDLDEFGNELIPDVGEQGAIDITFGALQVYNILDLSDLKGNWKTKEEAYIALQEQKSLLNKVKIDMLNGYSFEEAARRNNLNPEFTNSLLSTVDYRGEIDPGKMINIANSIISKEDENSWLESNRFVKDYSLNQAFLLTSMAQSTLYNKKYGNYGSVYESPIGDDSVFFLITKKANNPNIKKLGLKQTLDNLVIIKEGDRVYFGEQTPFKDVNVCGKDSIQSQLKIKTCEQTYNLIVQEKNRLHEIYNLEPLFKEELDPAFTTINKERFYREGQEFALESVTALDLIPIGRIAHITANAPDAIKNARRLQKIKGTSTISREFVEDIIAGEKALLHVRPALISGRGSAELIAKRGEFENIPALAKKYSC